jgi:hypothetical protein
MVPVLAIRRVLCRTRNTLGVLNVFFRDVDSSLAFLQFWFGNADRLSGPILQDSVREFCSV